MAVRNDHEESRERQLALTLLLQEASAQCPLTQDDIISQLTIDEYPVDPKRPRKVRAYQGSDEAVRQMFERDKKRIRQLGYQIETVAMDGGSTGYWIDDDAVGATNLDLSDDEEAVIRTALALYGFGPSGAIGLFGDGRVPDGGLESSQFLNPIVRALRRGRTLRFGYFSSSDRRRDVDPLALIVADGATYLVARPSGTTEIRGFRLSRITSMPDVGGEFDEVDLATRELALAWRPQYGKAPRPLDVSITTSAAMGSLIARQHPGAVVARKRDGVVEVGLRFDGPRAALRFVLSAGTRVRVESPKSLRADVRRWLEGVNRGPRPGVTPPRAAASSPVTSLGQALLLLRAVQRNPEGLRISELSARFSMSPELVRHIMDRLTTFEPMGGRFGFPAHIVKECDDWENEETDDSLYRAEAFDPRGAVTLRPLRWQDLFELNVALREAAHVYDDPAIESAIAKIEAVVDGRVRLDTAESDEVTSVVRDAIAGNERLKITYASLRSGEPEERVIEPREIRVLNGMAYVRAFCTTRDAWLTFRLDRIGAVLARSAATDSRPDDTDALWLTRVGDGGDDVVVVMSPEQRWLFEPLPGATWSWASDGRPAVQFRVTDRTFLDHLMVQAGPGAVVVTPEFADAGRALARAMRDLL